MPEKGLGSSLPKRSHNRYGGPLSGAEMPTAKESERHDLPAESLQLRVNSLFAGQPFGFVRRTWHRRAPESIHCRICVLRFLFLLGALERRSRSPQGHLSFRMMSWQDLMMGPSCWAVVSGVSCFAYRLAMVPVCSSVGCQRLL